MKRFDHVLVMVSIIIGLGVTQWLNDIGRLVESNSSIVLYVPHAIWATIAFGLLLQFWWAIWLYREVPDAEWDYPDYVIVLLAATFLYLVGELALPSELAPTSLAKLEGSVSMREHFELVSPWFYLCLGLYVSLTVALRRRVRGIPLLDRKNRFRFAGIGITVAATVLAFDPALHAKSALGLALGCALIFALFLCFNNPMRLPDNG